MDRDSGARMSADPVDPVDPALGPADQEAHLPDPARTVIVEAAQGSVPDPRRVVVVPGVSGTDTAAATAGLALALASVQPSDVLLVDVAPVRSPTDLAARFGLCAPGPGALLPVAPRLTYRSTTPDELTGPWPQRVGVVLVHCGPTPSREALDAALDVAGTVLLLTPDTDSGTRAAQAALDWLGSTGRNDLARGAVVVLAGGGTESGSLTGGPLSDRCRSVHRLAATAHAVAPGVLDPETIPDQALDALLDLAHEVADRA